MAEVRTINAYVPLRRAVITMSSQRHERLCCAVGRQPRYVRDPQTVKCHIRQTSFVGIFDEKVRELFRQPGKEQWAILGEGSEHRKCYAVERQCLTLA